MSDPAANALDDSELQQRLVSPLRRCLTDFQALRSVRRLSEGASQETYRIEVQTAAGVRLLALRRSPADSALLESGTIDMAAEASVLRAADKAGVQVPRVLGLLLPNDHLGSGILMEWLEGETLGPRILKSEQLAGARQTLARDCGRVLARLHQVDWHSEGLHHALPTFTPEELVHASWDYYRETTAQQPMIDFTARWLLENLPAPREPALVHSDFRNGNLMIDSHGIVAVLDWEMAHLGDPVRDLGWMCVNSWRFGRVQQAVGGFGTAEALLHGYAEGGGEAVSPEALHFWQVFGSFWWGVTCLRMAQSWRLGEVRSPERPAIGRRSSEAQMDCVNLLIPGPFELPKPTDPNEGQLPGAQELTRAVEEYLRDSTREDPRERFLDRVCGNALATVGRELQLRPALDAAEQGRLVDILGRSATLTILRTELVDALRDGLPLDTAGLAAHLRYTVAGQLSVDQPHYSALTDPHAAPALRATQHQGSQR